MVQRVKIRQHLGHPPRRGQGGDVANIETRVELGEVDQPDARLGGETAAAAKNISTGIPPGRAPGAPGH